MARHQAYSFGYFVPDLTHHLQKWEQDHVYHLRYYYLNPADNSTVYAALVFNDHTGEVNEFHAAFVDTAYHPTAIHSAHFKVTRIY